jgi:hypothetical protein
MGLKSTFFALPNTGHMVRIESEFLSFNKFKLNIYY